MQSISASAMNIDLYLFNFINGFAKKSRALDFFAVFCARYVPYLLLTFLSIFILIEWRLDMFLTIGFSAVLARFVIGEGIYYFYKRKRPLETLSVNSLIPKPNHPSFPSGHASAFFALSFALFPFNISVAVLFFTATCFLVFFRVLCGVHWPSDVAVGMVVGFFSFIVVWLSVVIFL